MAEVVFDDARDEVVAVVVSFVPAHPRGLGSLLTGGFKQVGVQLRREEVVGQALVDQRRGQLPAGFHQLGSVVRCPGRTVGTQISAERLLAPRALAGSADRRDGGHALEEPGVAQRQRQGAMAAHGMA